MQREGGGGGGGGGKGGKGGLNLPTFPGCHLDRDHVMLVLQLIYCRLSGNISHSVVACN